MNEITGARLSPAEGLCQTVRIPDPAEGLYSIVLHGAASGMAGIGIRAFRGEKCVLLYRQSCDVSNGDGSVSRLRIDATNGVLEQLPGTGELLLAEKAKPASGQAGATASGKGSRLFIAGFSANETWVAVSCIAVFFIVVLLVCWRKA
ncbi:MAG: hypothetical protein N2506_03675 [Dehalococcoidales bacterium]|nr:hypothetical protein [Dehalococcoidales bacterium]